MNVADYDYVNVNVNAHDNVGGLVVVDVLVDVAVFGDDDGEGNPRR